MKFEVLMFLFEVLCMCGLYFVSLHVSQHSCSAQRKACISWLSCHVDSRDGKVIISSSLLPSRASLLEVEPSIPVIHLLEMYFFCLSGCL